MTPNLKILMYKWKVYNQGRVAGVRRWSFKHIVIFLRLSLYVQQHSYKDVRVREYETRMFRLNGCVPINNLHRKS